MLGGILPKERFVYTYLGLLLLALLLLFPRVGKFNYSYKKGAPWAYETLEAQFDFPLLKTAEELQLEREAASGSVVPYYKYSEEIAQNAQVGLESIQLGFYNDLKPRLANSLASIYSRGVMSDEESPSAQKAKSASSVVFLQRDKRATKVPADEIYTLSAARRKLLSDFNKSYSGPNPDSLLGACKVYDLLVPNVIYDKEATSAVHAQSVDYISPTSGFVNAGEKIVSKGELVTAEIQQMLDSYKAEYENNLGYTGPRFKQWLGNGLVALTIVLILFFSLLYADPSILKDRKSLLYIVFIMVLCAALSLLIGRANADLLYMVPFTLIVLYLTVFFKNRVVLPVYTASLLPLLIYTQNGVELFVIFLVAGGVTMLLFSRFSKGWRQFVMAFIVFLFSVCTLVGFRFVNDVKGFSEMVKVVFLLLGALLSVAGYPLIFLFEKLFGLVSVSRLVELCDTNSRLLVEMSQKAPGTFQHSLQVMNMSEAAARQIGANVELVKAGALYHDIGKIQNPTCFVENETMGTKYHASLTPKQSAEAIIRHVNDGLAVAQKYGLPDVVKDFIRTHHGTTRTGYFYSKFLEEGGDESEAAAFTYPGPRPRTREQSIVMICDTVEAASRTLSDNSPETFDAFVEKMVDGKMKAGQFEESDITMKDLQTLKSFLKQYLKQLYHDRIVYPSEKEESKG